jgi:hypothetical protein
MTVGEHMPAKAPIATAACISGVVGNEGARNPTAAEARTADQ